MENQPKGSVSAEQIESWKKDHKVKNLHSITTEDDDGNEHITYVKKATLELLQLLANKAKQGQELKGLSMVFEAVRVGGSEEVLNDDMMRLDAMVATGKLFKRKEVKLKKL